jgi:hypothetical protein
MRVTQATRNLLAIRRQRRRLFAAGYEEITERGGNLWELHRGGRQDHRIVDVQIGVDGRSLFAKVEAQQWREPVTAAERGAAHAA